MRTGRYERENRGLVQRKRWKKKMLRKGGISKRDEKGEGLL